MAPANRRGRQAPGEQVGVEAVEMATGQLVDPQGTDGRPDVMVDLGRGTLTHSRTKLQLTVYKPE